MTTPITPRMHYGGGISHAHGVWLPGWPSCCTGRQAILIRGRGALTDVVADVNCKKCQRNMRLSPVLARELDAIATHAEAQP